MKKEQQDEDEGLKKGGLRTMPFIIANVAFEQVASNGLTPNMILYLMNEYNMGLARGTNLIFYWSAATSFMPILGAFLSDSYLGRFLTISSGCFFTLMGMVLFWVTTVIPQLKPPRCTRSCESPTSGQYAYLVFAFMLMSIGAGGIRACTLAFGAEQVDDREDPENKTVLETFFSWYYATICVSMLLSFTVIVYLQDHLGWRVGFGVPVLLMFLSALSFLIASPMYTKTKVEKSIITSFMQVIVAAFRNRKMDYPSPGSDGYYHRNGGTGETEPTNKLRFLNKACIVTDVSGGGVRLDPWRVCTVEQVKELKSLLRVMPFCSASVMLLVNANQGSFPVLQAKSMDRRLLLGFEIPAASLAFFAIVAATMWIALYDRVIIPAASRIKGKPVHLDAKLRMGVGLCLSCVGMAVSAVVERYRRNEATRKGYLHLHLHGPQNVSAMWLIPQNCLGGLAEAINVIGQSEFYYSEFPRSMSTFSAAVLGLQAAAAKLLASVVLSTVDRLTGGGGKESWVSSDID